MRPRQIFSPRLVLLGGCVLAFGASVINVTFLFETGTSVSHLTGDLSRFASGLASTGTGISRELLRVGTATVGFIVGATAAGFWVHQPQLEFSRPYGGLLSVMGLLLLLASPLRHRHEILAIGLTAGVCGLQNALASRYRGAILRTTHVTGILTDLGVTLGMRLRGQPIESWKLKMPVLLALAFFIGAFLGGCAHVYTDWPVLPWCGLGYLLGGFTFSIAKRRLHHPGPRQS